VRKMGELGSSVDFGTVLHCVTNEPRNEEEITAIVDPQEVRVVGRISMMSETMPQRGQEKDQHYHRTMLDHKRPQGHAPMMVQ
jgi:hypothetical protein